MGKRKGRKETQETLTSGDQSGEGGGKVEGFFACYLLTSLCPRFKGHTYIGYTLNPRRRIRQHNGEIGSGALRTKKKRPWEMVLCIYGFPTNIAALQFEWAWQHPVESLAVRTAAASLKSLSGLANKIKLAYTMLTLPTWQSLNLTVNLFSTKYQSYTSGCPALPEQMQTRVCSMDELPCYNVNDKWDDNKCEGSLLDSTEEEESSKGACEENVPHQINHRDGDDDDDAIVESSGCVAKPWVGWLKKSTINDFFSVRKSFSIASSCIVEKDMQSPIVVELITTTEFSEPLKKQSTTADKDQVLLIKSRDIISHEVEIIDVFTPSPCKKRRRSPGPEIIDLTNSPLFV